MIQSLGISGLSLLTLPAVFGPLGRRLRPNQWSVLCLVSLLAGTIAVMAAGVVISLPTALWLVGLPRAARTCEVMFGYLFSIGSPLAVVTLALTLSALTLGGRSLRRFRTVCVQSWAESGLSPRLDRYGPFEVVVFEDTRLRALSVTGRAGRRGQVHITTGLLGALLPEQLDVVCAHEEAHLRLAHHRHLGVATTVEGAMWFWPPSKSSARVLRRALERSADECAAGDSMRVRAQLASALLTVAVEIDRPVLAAFSALDGLVERVAAMREPTAKGKTTWSWPFIIVPGIVLAVVSFYALSRVGRGAYCWITMPGGCHLR